MSVALVPGNTPGVSEAARYVREQLKNAQAHYQKPFSVGSERQAALEKLAAIFEQCSGSGWDGDRACPLSQAAYLNAYRVIESLPAGLPMPDVGAEADGHFTLEWYQAKRRTLSVSVNVDGDLHYAGLFGSNRAFGTEVFLGHFPKALLELVGRVYA